MTLRTRNNNAEFILEMLAVHIFLIDGVFHLVTGMGAKTQCIRILHRRTIASRQKDADKNERFSHNDEAKIVTKPLDKPSDHSILPRLSPPLCCVAILLWHDRLDTCSTSP